MILGCQAFYAEQFFKRLQEHKPRAMIITSGTLTPFSEIESELNMTFPIKLVNEHVIDRANIFMSVLKSVDPGRHYLNLSHTNLTKNQHKVSEDIGQAVVNIIKEVHTGGVLVFFQSYDKMGKVLKDWEGQDFLNERRLGGKKLFFEDAEGLKLGNPGNASRSKIIKGTPKLENFGFSGVKNRR